jgi:tetratricopeptide (TPR) repeat protein
MPGTYSHQFKQIYDRANDLYLRCNFYEAIAQFEAAVSLEPANPAGYYGLGLVYAKLADWDEAIRQNEQAISRDRGMFEAHMNLGQAYVKKAIATGDRQYWKLARDAHRSANALKPNSTAALHCLAFDEWKCRNASAAAKLLESLIEIDPQNRSARHLLASIRLLQGRLSAAWAALRPSKGA